MSENYRPGTIAALENDDADERVVLTDDDGWHWVSTGLRCLEQRDIERRVRPLVVLDPGVAPKFTVSALRMHVDTARSQGFGVPSIVARLADQIEAQTRPPKPDEPTGLGAVVKDVGKSWVHFGNGCWIQETPNACLRVQSWSDFSDDVEVDR